MPDLGAPGGTGGFTLALITESFAVRALLGSVAAAGLAALAVRLRLVRGTSGRRLLVLAPVLTAAVAAGATGLESAAYLPQLQVMEPNGTVRELRDLIGAATGSRNLLVVVHAAIAGTLLSRRALGALSVRRLLQRGRSAAGERRLTEAMARLAPRMGLPQPHLLLIAGCPGGAFTYGTLRPVVAVDPALLSALDQRELEGLLAHELAHVRRRDGLLCLLIGVFRDLTFFLPTIALAARWLRREQEESADEVAARSTERPVALASSILKVWDRSSAGGPRVACAAVPGRLRLAPAGGAPEPAAPVSDGARLVAHRVERLLAGHLPLSRGRRSAEVGLVAGILTIALFTALTVPHWISVRTRSNQLWVTYLSAAATGGDAVEESPALATFHALTRTPAQAGAATGAGSHTARDDLSCPCVETQAQLREGVAARAPEAQPNWLPQERSSPFLPGGSTRTLLALDERGPRVGVFLVADDGGADRAAEAS